MRWISIILLILVLGLIYWMIDSYRYDKELEADHIRETGVTWDEVEKGTEVWKIQ